MSSLIQTGNAIHDAACLKSLGMLQTAIAGSPTQATVNAAYITHLRNCRTSALANGCSHEPFDVALKGTFGLNS